MNKCEHDFFKCHVPSGDSCVPIYHDVCKKCHFDKTKGIIMPDNIWEGYAERQLKRLNNLMIERKEAKFYNKVLTKTQEEFDGNHQNSITYDETEYEPDKNE